MTIVQEGKLGGAFAMLVVLSVSTVHADESSARPFDSLTWTDVSTDAGRIVPAIDESARHDAPPPLLTYADQSGEMHELASTRAVDVAFSSAAVAWRPEAILWSLEGAQGDATPLAPSFVVGALPPAPDLADPPRAASSASPDRGSTAFAVAPGPASIVLLALAGLIGSRRR